MVKKKFDRSIFFPAKSKRLARAISIESPTAFRRSIKKLKREGLTLRERRALMLARTRAAVQLKRKRLSMKERRQFRTISKMEIPRVTKRR